MGREPPIMVGTDRKRSGGRNVGEEGQVH